MRRVVISLLALGALTLAPAAHATYGPGGGGFGADIVSVDNASDEQANASTSDADLSADGRYVVFQTRATNFFEDDGETQQEKELSEPPGTLREGGIFRYDRQTGGLELVASGNLVVSEGKEAGKVLVRGAQNPSVSAEGRYVAFATGQQLVPQDKNENLDVYVRDMDKAANVPGAFVLVSAQNGSEEPPVYDDSSISPPIPGGDPGTQLWPNTAISENGRYVLFRTAEVPSSFPQGSTPDMPPNQLFVRDLWEKTTTLVTRTTTGEPAGGDEGPATLSADGSTVAWVGRNAEAQTTFLQGEDLDDTLPYYLWRRWQEPRAPTRRITGIADPEDPECPPGGSVEDGNHSATGACYGPLTVPESSSPGISSQVPALSEDGYTVAFLAAGALRPNTLKPDSLDVFLTSMMSGLTRKAATRELTLAVNGAQGDGNASIASLALSSDGTHIAFVSQRNAFVLPEPAPVGSFSVTAQQSELDVIDLKADTVERAVVGVEGAEPNGSTSNNPTLSADGSVLAFVSSASNLISGDANDASDAFTATHQTPAGTAPAPANFNSVQSGFSLIATASPELGLSVKRAADGGLILLVETPGAGKLTAQATGTITTKSNTKKTRKKKVVLAHSVGQARAEGTTTLVLHLMSKYTKTLDGAGKLKALVTVTYTPSPPGEALSAEATSTFISATRKKVSATRKKVSATRKKAKDVSVARHAKNVIRVTKLLPRGD